jgi:predicted DNA-binding protein YlxM (UPF0122 family)
MDTLKNRVDHFNHLITTGQNVKAMELYYSNDVQLQENEAEPRIDKQVCITREKAALDKFDLLLEITKQAIDEVNQVVFSEYQMVITEKISGNIIRRPEVSVQQWHDEVITKEKFYYNQSSLPV